MDSESASPPPSNWTFGWRELIAVALVILVAIGLVVPAVQQAREAAHRTQWRNNLKQLGLALHNYHDNFNQLPPGGIFNAEGRPYHEWTSSFQPYLDSFPWYHMVDFHRPWDDPQNIDLFLNWHQWPVFTDPSIGTSLSPDGLQLNPVAANQNLMYRNSSVGFDDIPDKAGTLLLADAYGDWIPVGYPFGWRDVALGLHMSPQGFGNSVREGTHTVLVDGSVRYFSKETDPKVWAALAGPEKLHPTPEQVAKPREPYQLTVTDYVRHDFDQFNKK